MVAVVEAALICNTFSHSSYLPLPPIYPRLPYSGLATTEKFQVKIAQLLE